MSVALTVASFAALLAIAALLHHQRGRRPWLGRALALGLAAACVAFFVVAIVRGDFLAAGPQTAEPDGCAGERVC